MSRSRAAQWWGVVGVVLLAINLRPGATSVGPVLAEMKADLGMDATTAGFVTAMPGVAFAIFGALAVTIGLRLGLTTALAVGALVTTAGLLVRSVTDSVPAFLLLSLLALAGMAIGNVLVPAFIKSRFPNRLASLMSVYTISLAIGATTASLVAAPLAEVSPGGWRASLGAWGLVAAVAAILWLGIAAVDHRRRRSEVAAVGPQQPGSVFGVAGSRKAVALAVFFGSQSMQAYVQFGWVAQMYRDGGLSPTLAGALVSLIAGLGIPAGFIMPAVASKVRDPRPYVVGMGVLLVAGYLGIWLIPATLPALWAVLLGVSGFAFPFALALINARTREPRVATQLSGFTQSIGYCFTAVGPFLVGALFDLTGGWTIPLWFLMASSVVFVVSGWIAAAPGYVDDELAARA